MVRQLVGLLTLTAQSDNANACCVVSHEHNNNGHNNNFAISSFSVFLVWCCIIALGPHPVSGLRLLTKSPTSLVAALVRQPPFDVLDDLVESLHAKGLDIGVVFEQAMACI